jgi:hypothetical protein
MWEDIDLVGIMKKLRMWEVMVSQHDRIESKQGNLSSIFVMEHKAKLEWLHKRKTKWLGDQGLDLYEKIKIAQSNVYFG